MSLSLQRDTDKIKPTGQTTDTALPWLIELDEVDAQQHALVGNKALGLAQMLRTGTAVPAGFCITTVAFRHGYRANRPHKSRLTDSLCESILAAFNLLLQRHPDCRFAVRSSALEEDSQTASWAGMFHSSLNIDSASGLLEAVERGFDSLHSDRVRLYRQQSPAATGNPSPEPAMALIVQCQIEPTASGMVFTRNPLVSSGHPDHQQLCINAVRGLAEPLADGETDGDLYWLDPDNRLQHHQLQRHHLQHNHLEQQHVGNSAPTSKPGGRSDQSRQPPILNRAQLRQIAQAARQLEQQFGYPLDIEFALQNQQLWLLQARPIASSVAGCQSTDQARNDLSQPAQLWLKQEQQRLQQRLRQLQHQQQLKYGPGILSNSNIAELLPSPTPMSFALFNQIFAGPGGAIPNGRRALGYATGADSTTEMFELVAGQPYFHIEIDARTYQCRGNKSSPQAQPLPVRQYLDQIRTDPQLANYPEFGLYQQFSRAPNAGPDNNNEWQRYRHCRRFHRNMGQHGKQYLHQYRGWVEDYLTHNLQQQRDIELGSLNAPQLIIQINRWIDHLRQFSCCHFVMAARLGFYFAESLRFELQQHLGDQTEDWISRLLQALPGSRINQQSFDLQAVSEQQLPLQQYLGRYGHLSSNELELSLPRYDENPDQVEALLARSSQASVTEQPVQAFERQHRQRKQQERQLSQQLDRLGLSAGQRRKIWSDLRLARRFLPLRESIKYYYAGEYALIRKALLQLSERLRLGADQIFYLHPNELPLCLKQLPAIRRLIRQRQRQHQLTLEIALQQPLPAVLFGNQIDLFGASRQPPNIPPGGNDQPGSRHHGQPMAVGFTRGKVRMIDPQRCDLHQLMASVDKDDIIVTRSANLGLAPLLRKVAGLVVEVGGLLAHSACQAREAGIPAMVLPDATRILNEGSRVTLDGKRGCLYF